MRWRLVEDGGEEEERGGWWYLEGYRVLVRRRVIEGWFVGGIGFIR